MLSIGVGFVLIALMAVLSWWSTTEQPPSGRVERVVTYGETKGLQQHTHRFPPGD